MSDSLCNYFEKITSDFKEIVKTPLRKTRSLHLLGKKNDNLFLGGAEGIEQVKGFIYSPDPRMSLLVVDNADLKKCSVLEEIPWNKDNRSAFLFSSYEAQFSQPNHYFTYNAGIVGKDFVNCFSESNDSKTEGYIILRHTSIRDLEEMIEFHRNKTAKSLFEENSQSILGEALVNLALSKFDLVWGYDTEK